MCSAQEGPKPSALAWKAWTYLQKVNLSCASITCPSPLASALDPQERRQVCHAASARHRAAARHQGCGMRAGARWSRGSGAGALDMLLE